MRAAAGSAAAPCTCRAGNIPTEDLIYMLHEWDRHRRDLPRWSKPADGCNRHSHAPGMVLKADCFRHSETDSQKVITMAIKAGDKMPGHVRPRRRMESTSHGSALQGQDRRAVLRSAFTTCDAKHLPATCRGCDQAGASTPSLHGGERRVRHGRWGKH
jgi:hypothetical protein